MALFNREPGECGSCRWWGKQPGAIVEDDPTPPDMHVCAKFDDDEDYVVGGAYVSEHFPDYTRHNGADLVTHRDFGCILHGPKKET
jgi:hypothetical protein